MNSAQEMTFQEYLDHPAYASHTLSVLINKTPAHLKAFKPKEDTDDIRDGRLFHDAILFPESFEERVVEPPFTRKGQIAKPTQEWMNFFLECEDKGFLKEDINFIINKPAAKWLNYFKADINIINNFKREQIEGIRNSIEQHEYVHSLINNSLHETTFIMKANPKYGDLQLKSKPDLISVTGCTIADLKFVTDARKHKGAIVQYGYDIQAAMQILVSMECDKTIKCKRYEWIVIEKFPPYAIKLYGFNLSSGFFMEAARRVERGLYQLGECLRTGHWPGYEESEDVDYPLWMERELADEEMRCDRLLTFVEQKQLGEAAIND